MSSLPKIANRWEFSETRHEIYSQQNPMIDCPTCDGDGDIYVKCDCCHNEDYRTCEDCLGSGEIRYLESVGPREVPLVSRAMYRRETIKELKAWAAWTNIGLLDLMAYVIKNNPDLVYRHK